MLDAPDQPPPFKNPAPPAPHISTLDDQDLIAFAVQAQVRQNADHAHRLEAYATLRDRCAEQAGDKEADQGYFAPTPLRETALEFSGALHVPERRIETDLATRDRLAAWFPPVWERCLSGRLDLWRAQALIDAAEDLADEADIEGFAEMMEEYFAKHDDPDSPLVPIERHRLCNAARYRKLRFTQKSAKQNYHEAFNKRRAWKKVDEVGTAMLAMTGSAYDVLACDYRLTLIAKKRCEAPGETRTLEQMRSDTMRDLLLGRLRVGATNSELEQDRLHESPAEGAATAADASGPGDGDGNAAGDPADTFEFVADVGAFARPVINVTVPLSSLIGLTDDPGMLAGGGVISADAIQQIAQDPQSTWYRLLTDDSGRFVELSSTGYQPSDPLWRTVVARDGTCVWPNCQRPAVQCECDHRTPFPAGRTCECNLDCLCHRHHMAKHSEGVSVKRLDDGSYVITTKRGSTLTRRPPELPA
ncbi:HNH endonuclease signature motif containing protein [Nocardioides mesophilus]|uniref:HNH endonuclease n=1 Tax=Nocardioides mesophilus TaxID=433659 RepID=A0A7G9R9K8_9ACTN|nr:HNH endonuclease signature motif containing protein [Nocardioides mesophilus]QNN52283.1 HNH endonuclease [Nocardioides mesophilus]